MKNWNSVKYLQGNSYARKLDQETMLYSPWEAFLYSAKSKIICMENSVTRLSFCFGHVNPLRAGNGAKDPVLDWAVSFLISDATI